MRKIDSSDSSSGSIRELANEINASLKSRNTLKDGIGHNHDVFLCHFIRHYYVHHKDFIKYNARVLIQPIDGTVIEPVHVSDLNQFDLIITPAHAGERILRDCGVYRQIEVVPNYFDAKDIVAKLDRLEHRGILPQLRDDFIFYHESTLQPRKNISALVSSYLMAFSDSDISDKVHLVIKGFRHKDVERTTTFIMKMRTQYALPAKISLVSSDFSKSFLRKLWSTIDCYVSFAHMEGFGIPLLRMAVNNKPIITLRSEISGYMDFLNDGNTYFVESKKCPLAEEGKLIYDLHKSHWEDVADIQQASDVFKRAYTDFVDGILKRNTSPLTAFSKEVVMKRYNQLIQSC